MKTHVMDCKGGEVRRGQVERRGKRKEMLSCSVDPPRRGEGVSIDRNASFISLLTTAHKAIRAVSHYLGHYT